MTRSAGRTLASAYPPPVRRRWGTQLALEIDSRGASVWIDSLVGAAGLWLRPAQWPVSTGSQLRRAVVVLALTTAALTGIGVRGFIPAPVTANHGLTAAGLAVLAVGLLALTPLPRPRTSSLAAMASALAKPVALSSMMIAAVYLLAHLSSQPAGPARAAEIAFYWLTLLTAVTAPALAICRVDPDHLLIPGRDRATVGLAVVAAGQAFGGTTELALVHTSGAVVLAAVELALGTLTVLALTDLRRHHLA